MEYLSAERRPPTPGADYIPLSTPGGELQYSSSIGDLPMLQSRSPFNSGTLQSSNYLKTQPESGDIQSQVAQYVSQLINPGPAKPEMPDHSHDKPRGFLGGVKHVLEHAGKGALMSLAGGGGIPGAIIGATIGGLRPEMADRAEFNLITKPRWEREHKQAQADADGTLDRAGKISSITDIDPFTGRPTLRARREDRAIKAQEDLAQHREGLLTESQLKRQDAEKRADASDKRARINQLLSAGRIPGRQFSPASKAELQNLLGITLPDDFDPMRYEVREDSQNQYQIIGISQSGRATVAPVVTDKGQPVTAPPRQSAQTPQYVVEGKARAELQNELGIKDPSAWVPNPQFEEAVRAEMEADKQAAQAGGYNPSSEAEIRRRVQRKQKLAPHIRAGEAITPDMIKQKAAEIYEREQKNRPGVTVTAPPPASKKAPASKQMDADEKEYQQLYPSLNNQQRKKLEDSYQQEYGRPPRPPSTKTSRMLPTDTGAQQGPAGDSIAQEGYEPSQSPVSLRFASQRQSADVAPNAPPPMKGLRQIPELQEVEESDIDGIRMSGQGTNKKGFYEVEAIIPPEHLANIKDLQRGLLRRMYLSTVLGWNKDSYDKWKTENPNQPLPNFTLIADKPGTNGVLKIRVPLRQLEKLQKYTMLGDKAKRPPRNQVLPVNQKPDYVT
jgi:hypothetical protein